MDELDFQILRSIDKNCRRSFSDIAKTLGVSVRNISRRIEHMLEIGVIERFRLVFNYSRLGFRQHIAFLRPPREKMAKDYFRELQTIPEIGRVWKHIDGGYTFTIFSRNAKHLEDINIELLQTGVSLTGRSETRMHLPADIPFSLLDWRITHYLYNNSRATIGDTACDLDVSKKTVSRRLRRFEDLKLVLFTPIINFEVITGINTGIVSFETIGPSKEIYQEIQNNSSIKYWRSAGSVSPSIVLFLYGKNMTELYDMFTIIRSRKDIKFGRLSIIIRNWENSSIIEDAILEKIQNY